MDKNTQEDDRGWWRGGKPQVHSDQYQTSIEQWMKEAGEQKEDAQSSKMRAKGGKGKKPV